MPVKNGAVSARKQDFHTKLKSPCSSIPFSIHSFPNLSIHVPSRCMKICIFCIYISHSESVAVVVVSLLHGSRFLNVGVVLEPLIVVLVVISEMHFRYAVLVLYEQKLQAHSKYAMSLCIVLWHILPVCANVMPFRIFVVSRRSCLLCLIPYRYSQTLYGMHMHQAFMISYYVMTTHMHVACSCLTQRHC